MDEIESKGPWPDNVISDINYARAALNIKMHFPTHVPTVRVYLSTILEKVLDHQLGKTDTTYRKFFIDNDLATIHEWKHAKDDVAIVRSEDHEVTIKNIRFDIPKLCAFCPNEIPLHREAVKLKDERLVCHECYAKIFDSILLRGLQGSVKNHE